jgi:hypothetical protein
VLAQAWERLESWPTGDHAWVAEVRVSTSGTDASWQGHHDFVADLTASRFAAHDLELRLDLRGKASVEAEANLASVFLDRLGMWYGVDPQARGRFAECFAGATIGAPDRQGWQRVQDHPMARIRVQDGRVREIVEGSGRRLRFHYEQFAGKQLITRIERGVRSGAEVLITPREVGGLIVPGRFEFRRIFGADWGPEVFEFSGMRLDD